MPSGLSAVKSFCTPYGPGSIVGDEVLTQSVIKLRRALGDDPRSPSYIETIPKRGYRLIARVDKPGEIPSRARRCDASFRNDCRRAPHARNRSFGLAAGILFVLIDRRRVRLHKIADVADGGCWVRMSLIPKTGARPAC